MGQRFLLPALRHLIEQPDYRCDHLIEQRLVHPDGEGYLFAHALIREGIYVSLLKSTRRALHRRAAEWFAGRDAVLHAEHLDRAGDPEAARAYVEAAVAQAAQYHHRRALELAARGAELAQDDGVRYALSELEGDVLRETGAIDLSIVAFERALRHARSEREQCRAWIGVAAALGIEDRHAEALAALTSAETLAAAHPWSEERARIHYHRGNVLFPLGRIDECLEQHERARDYARAAGSRLLEACALSGLGDAYYQRGRMRTAHEHFERCVALCRADGLARIEAANLAMRGITRFYLNDVSQAIEDGLAAAELARRVGNQRDEGLARNGLGTLLLYAGEWQAAQREAERSLALVRAVGAKLFEAENVCTLASVLWVSGDAVQARELMERAYALIRETGLRYNGPWILGVLALVTSDPQQRRRILSEGEELLRTGCVGHSYLHFYQHVIDVALAEDNWSEAERYAELLEQYTQAEPLPWSDLFIARGRALARWGAGTRNRGTVRELRRIRVDAQQVGLRAALPALQAALAESNEA